MEYYINCIPKTVTKFIILYEIKIKTKKLSIKIIFRMK
jgi:hypothetical protein